MHPAPRAAAFLALAMACALCARAEDNKDQKAPKEKPRNKKHSAAELGMEILVPPTFLRGRMIAPGEPPAVPLLFVFAHPDDAEARKAVKKVDAAAAKKGGKGYRVVLVVGGADRAECQRNAVAFGATHLDILADPAGILQAQFGFTVGAKDPFFMRSYFTDRKVAPEVDCESFLKENAAPAKDAAPKKDAAKADPPPAPRSAPPRLRDAYAALDAGENAKALVKFRSVAGDKSGKETAVVEEAKARVEELERMLDERLHAMRGALADQYVGDLEEARTTLMAAWRDDGKSKAKIDLFIKDWEKKDEVKNEYAARKIRARLWQSMASGATPDKKALGAAFLDIAEKCPGTATGTQAAALAKLLLGKK